MKTQLIWTIVLLSLGGLFVVLFGLFLNIKTFRTFRSDNQDFEKNSFFQNKLSIGSFVIFLVTVFFTVVSIWTTSGIFKDLFLVVQDDYNEVTGQVVVAETFGSDDYLQRVSIEDKDNNSTVQVLLSNATVEVGEICNVIYLPNTKIGILLKE